MGTCGGKKKDNTKNMKKKEQENNNPQNGEKVINQQNIITNRNEQNENVSKQQHVIKTEIINKPVEDQSYNTKQDNKQDVHKLSDIMPKPEIPITTTPIIQISKKKFQDDDPAKHHLEV